jgi:glyoxylase-like metal-dependent hydrolase (beta-lactamase superfamily II)
MQATEIRETQRKRSRKKKEIRENPLPLPEREERVCRICGWHAAQDAQPEECALCHAGPAAFVKEYELEVRDEAKAEIEPLDEGLWRLRNSFGWGHACYLVEKPSGPVLIDCPDVFTPELVDFLKARGGVARILFCHHHFLGAGQRARQLFSAQTILHRGDDHSKIVTATIDSWITDDAVAFDGDGGEPIRGLHIGGHTPGSAFFSFKGMLFTGDAFSGWNGPMGWFYTDINAVRKARQLLTEIPIRAIYSSCGHLTKGASRRILGGNGKPAA